jgi:hypothetical protein
LWNYYRRTKPSTVHVKRWDLSPLVDNIEPAYFKKLGKKPKKKKKEGMETVIHSCGIINAVQDRSSLHVKMSHLSVHAGISVLL